MVSKCGLQSLAFGGQSQIRGNDRRCIGRHFIAYALRNVVLRVAKSVPNQSLDAVETYKAHEERPFQWGGRRVPSRLKGRAAAFDKKVEFRGGFHTDARRLSGGRVQSQKDIEPTDQETGAERNVSECLG